MINSSKTILFRRLKPAESSSTLVVTQLFSSLMRVYRTSLP